MIVSRAVDPAELAVVSVTSIAGDNVKNAIASTARIEGDCRHSVTQSASGSSRPCSASRKAWAAAHGCSVEIAYERVFVPLVNDPEATGHGLSAAAAVFGADRVDGNAPRMGASEDFAQALGLAPGAFGNIGNGDSAPLHSPEYDFNDEALVPGVAWFLELVRRRLPTRSI